MHQLLVTLILFSQAVFANEMSFDIGKDVNGLNTPYVSITICEPGTHHCETIDRIKLDTGSDGLRIFKSAIKSVHLPIVKNTMGQDLAMCAEMAGGTGYWGPVAKADVMLGDESAPNTRVQITDLDYPKDNIPCKALPADGRNGILGMGATYAGNNGQRFFSCSSGRCSISFPTAMQRPINPMMSFLKDKNGFIMSSPKIPTDGLTNVSGKIIFGLGTRPNNQVQAANVQTCHLGESGFHKVEFRGKTFNTMADSGSYAYNIPPGAMTVPYCRYSPQEACPRREMKVEYKLLNADGTQCAMLTVPIVKREAEGTFGEKSWVNGGVVSRLGGLLDSMLTLGMPFFYGRDVYYGFQGRVSPLGTGPLMAFTEQSN